MSRLKEHLKSFKAQFPAIRPSDIDPNSDLADNLIARVCIFCYSARVMMFREIENGLLIECLHCADCDKNWVIMLDLVSRESEVIECTDSCIQEYFNFPPE
jgi:hypothetical protein